MAALPQRASTVSAVYAALAEHLAERRRAHLGASVLGRECARALWYAFRWCDERTTDGRVLRLFRRGQLEEEWIARDLVRAGLTVHTHDEHGKQFRFEDLGGHVGGSMDGAALGVIEAPKTWHVLECKTYNAKRFALLARDGVESAAPDHYAQMQLYMHWSGMQRALYVAVCKDNDELHIERIHYEKQRALVLLEKARQVVTAPEPLEGISDKPEFYKCKWCSSQAVCHHGRVPEPSCRTCIHSTPTLEGGATWMCKRYGRIPSVDAQLAGCPDHVYLPALVPAAAVDADEAGNYIVYQTRSGALIRNGTPDEHGPTFASSELYAAQGSDFAILTDPAVHQLRREMGATVHESKPR